MNQDAYDGWTLFVRSLQAAATLAAVVVALWGDKLKALWFKPNLQLDLVSTAGEKTRTYVTPAGGGQVSTHDARFYHVRLRNGARWPKASQTQVFLLRVHEPGPGDTTNVTWSGEMPIRWAWAELHPLQRTLGPEAICDLCSVIENAGLFIYPIVVSPALDSFRHTPMGRRRDMTLVLQARATEGESAITSFRIAWDGRWEPGEAEMMKHLVIKKVVPE